MGSLDLFMYLVGFVSDIFIFPQKKKKKVYLLHKLVESNLKIWFVGAICLYRKNVVEQLQGLVSVPK